jgi:hypothetical protein
MQIMKAVRNRYGAQGVGLDHSFCSRIEPGKSSKEHTLLNHLLSSAAIACGAFLLWQIYTAPILHAIDSLKCAP